MQLIRGQIKLTRSLTQSVLALGSFDGLHLGHQQLLQSVTTESIRLGGIPKVVLTFEPIPQLYFNKNGDFLRLMYWREKWLALQWQQIDYMVCLRFASALVNLSATAFVSDILVKQLGVKTVVVGNDFRFGAKRTGDIDLLHRLGQQYNFSVLEQPTYILKEHRVSSTRIRTALIAGDIEMANQLLGQPYFLCGRVVSGDQRGSTLLGFPTANIDLRRKPVPLSGIFVVTVDGLAATPLPGVASLGVRPMFDGHERWLEVYLFDFNRKIYGQHLRINFLHKLRDECCFASIDALIAQMQQDVVDAQAFLLKGNKKND